MCQVQRRLKIQDSITQTQIRTTGDQTYSGVVTLNHNGWLQSGGTVNFGDAVDGAYYLGITGNAIFDDAVGGTTPLNWLHVSGTSVINKVTTSGEQVYHGAVTLGGDAS